MHRDSVLWFLGRKLEEVGEVQRGMMERRLEREVERGRSVLYKIKGPGGAGEIGGMDGFTGEAGQEAGGSGGSGYRGGGGAAMDDEDRRQIEQQLSPEQLQLFARENQDMLKHYEDTLDQVRYVNRQLFAQGTTLSTPTALLTHNTEQQSAPCLKSPSCKRHWCKIWTSKAPIYHNSLLTRCLRLRMLGVGIKN